MGRWGLRVHAGMGAAVLLCLLASPASAGGRAAGPVTGGSRVPAAAGLETEPGAEQSEGRRSEQAIGHDNQPGAKRGPEDIRKVDGLDGVESVPDLDDAATAVDDLVGDATLRTDGVIGGLVDTDPDPPQSPEPSPGTGGDPEAGATGSSRNGGGATSAGASTSGHRNGGSISSENMTPAGSRDIGTSGLTHGALQLARPLAPAVAVAVIGLLLLAAAARGNDRLVKRDADGSRAGSWRL